jgi:hypothetical protein
VVKRHPRCLVPGEPEPGTGEPEFWEFQIGGYQVLHKWLKDRKGRKLAFDDLFHWEKIGVALKETMRLMGEIGELILARPID